MKQRKLLTSLFLAATLSISLLTGCGNTSSSTSETKQTESSVTDEQTTSVQKESGTDENQKAADQLLSDLKGTYQELWPVILADEYDQLWLDDSASIVGEDNAQAAVEKMSSMVTGTVTGEEAVETYKDRNMAYDCEFLQNIDRFASEQLMAAKSAISRIEAVLQEKPLEESNTPKQPKDASVVFQDVSFTYQGTEKKALDHVSFEIPSGKTIALVGASGGSWNGR